MSKVFERYIHKPVIDNMAVKLSYCVTGFKKSDGNGKKVTDKRDCTSATFMDLSKAQKQSSGDVL